MSRSPHTYNRDKQLNNNRRDFSVEEDVYQLRLSEKRDRASDDNTFSLFEDNHPINPNEAAQENMKSWWDGIAQQASQTYNCTPQAWERQQIKNALGRPVLREILDKNNAKILDVGDLITYRAVERAKKADVLDLLLSSVYENESNFSSTEN